MSGHPRERHVCVEGSLQRLLRQLRLGSQLQPFGDAGRRTPLRVAGPRLGHMQLPVEAPVWKMDTFRDWFLAAFGPPAHSR